MSCLVVCGAVCCFRFLVASMLSGRVVLVVCGCCLYRVSTVVLRVIACVSGAADGQNWLSKNFVPGREIFCGRGTSIVPEVVVSDAH
jgi:hypothetical protein